MAEYKVKLNMSEEYTIEANSKEEAENVTENDCEVVWFEEC